MTTTSFHELSADLDGLLSAMDRRLSAPDAPYVAAGGPSLPPPGSVPLSVTARLERQLAASSASCFRVIGVLRSLRGVAGPMGVAAPVPVPQVGPAPRRDRTAIAPLSVPERVLKRNYNYFDRLNADLIDLAEKHRMIATESSPISPY